MARKLYVVTVSRSAYVLADSWNHACDFADDIDLNESRDVDIHEAADNELRWSGDSCVYNEENEDIPLRALLKFRDPAA